MTASANERIDAASKLITDDLEAQPWTNWNSVLRRYDEAYQNGVRFLVFAPTARLWRAEMWTFLRRFGIASAAAASATG